MFETVRAAGRQRITVVATDEFSEGFHWSRRPAADIGYSCELKLSPVSKRLNRSAEYNCPVGALIETANPSAASLRASITATMALARMLVV